MLPWLPCLKGVFLYSALLNSAIALYHQPVHVRMTLAILLISKGVKQLLDCPILPKMGLFSMWVY